MNKLYRQRFQELCKQLDKLENTKKNYYSEFLGSYKNYVDDDILLNWKVKVKDLLSKVCREESQHFREFLESETATWGDTNYNILQRMKAVFLAAKEDFEGGYLLSVRSLVQAEMFDSQLEQAEELFKSGYITAAAVIAGVVLETTLRELCDRSSIAHGKLDKMNADLAKAGIYNKLTQKRITALADIRNSAAHGKPEEFTDQDVLDMIRDVTKFVADYLPSH
ncbi:conserved hypothetical protein [Gloeothece citriformis PCC 7424]|uniref:DUF4145 domain-containing protein n=1 Tax=Gloeothece citriformis (strain PCC 7424) TaxID=65393 RepID=B7KF85_GLOC7|nr:DUF4145 domain-containing protein [Gloeothece citriformis]ACK71801.1 conserved hypothetical protein [Gloeothece citriformis PCC 7424]